MVEISLSGSGEGPGWVTAPGYSTAAFPAPPIRTFLTSSPRRGENGPYRARRRRPFGSDRPPQIGSSPQGQVAREDRDRPARVVSPRHRRPAISRSADWCPSAPAETAECNPESRIDRPGAQDRGGDARPGSLTVIGPRSRDRSRPRFLLSDQENRAGRGF